MAKLSARLFSKDPFNPQHVDVVDGLRALSVIIIGWYHIWQQSWLSPLLDLSALGLGSVSFDVIPRTGYLFVDFMLFISAFCLFLPHARAMAEGQPGPGFRLFYLNRAIRILPLYLLCVIPLFICAVTAGRYPDLSSAVKELIADLTFTQTFFPQTYLNAQINGVLWTVAVEMQFYLLFPLLAGCFRKHPLPVFAGMVVLSEAYLRLYALPNPDGLRMTLNQLPAFFGIFACGMLSAVIYEWIAAHVKRSVPLALVGIGLSAFSVILLRKLLFRAASAQPVQVFQAEYRLALGALFAMLTVSLCCAPRFIRFLFSNPLTRFFAAISYPFYIWHQWIAVKLKAWRIPFWEGDTLPNMSGNVIWQKRYTLLCFVLAIAAAALFTYLIDRPVKQSVRKIINPQSSKED